MRLANATIVEVFLRRVRLVYDDSSSKHWHNLPGALSKSSNPDQFPEWQTTTPERQLWDLVEHWHQLQELIPLYLLHIMMVSIEDQK